ncbi:MAG: hypothetical protein AABX47_05140 [Nanoarchaeota archaeon]
MDKQDVIDICIIAWIAIIFIAYHYQYLALAKTFIAVYADRYMPGLAPILSRLIP